MFDWFPAVEMSLFSLIQQFLRPVFEINIYFIDLNFYLKLKSQIFFFCYKSMWGLEDMIYNRKNYRTIKSKQAKNSQ